MSSHETQFVPSGFGWRRDLQDFRDLTWSNRMELIRMDHPAADETNELTRVLRNRLGEELDNANLPAEADLRNCFSAVDDQGSINSLLRRHGV